MARTGVLENQEGLGALRLTVRGKRAAVTIAVLVAAAVGFAGGRADAASTQPQGPVVEVVVAPGDTLWGLAGRVLEAGEDRRDVISRIQRLNDMPTAELVAGTVLLLPAE